MQHIKTFQRKKLLVFILIIISSLGVLTGRLAWLMLDRSAYYSQKARDLHERERSIKAARGEIRDRNGIVLAANQSVCTISVIHRQIEDQEAVIAMLTKELGDKILAYHMPGVKVDEDYKRYYPFDSLASRVIGFTGSDNQGIIGLEVKYDE